MPFAAAKCFGPIPLPVTADWAIGRQAALRIIPDKWPDAIRDGDSLLTPLGKAALTSQRGKVLPDRRGAARDPAAD
jgi:hypothetical protein